MAMTYSSATMLSHQVQHPTPLPSALPSNSLKACSWATGQRVPRGTGSFHSSFSAVHTRLCGRSSRRGLPVRCGVAEPGGVPAPMGQRTKYNDSWFDRLFMGLFQRKMEYFTGSKVSSKLEGYDALVDAARRVMQGRTPEQQRQVVANVLMSMLPPNAPATFRRLFPPTKLSAEINAAITVPFFQWLVGPAKLTEVEVNGVKQWSGVKITKCRYLESSGCVGMCVNMCKLPTQDFFTNDFGLPLTMTPNFEDMSCEMVFGQMPPALADDPALQNTPCFKDTCPMAKPELPRCPTLTTPS